MQTFILKIVYSYVIEFCYSAAFFDKIEKKENIHDHTHESHDTRVRQREAGYRASTLPHSPPPKGSTGSDQRKKWGPAIAKGRGSDTELTLRLLRESRELREDYVKTARKLRK